MEDSNALALTIPIPPRLLACADEYRPNTGNWRYGDLRPARLSAVSAASLDRAYVSSLRHVERSVWISLTTLTCLLRIKGYGTYPAGATFG
jgi:hypothetical protein